MSDNQTVVLEREYRASIERVFEAWTNPDYLRQWFRGSEATTIESAEVDLRVGGGYRIVILGGEDRFVAFGSYTSIERPTLLEFTWSWEVSSVEPSETLVRVELSPLGESTRLRLIHSRLSSQTSMDAHSTGWTGVLNSLERILQ